MAENKKSFLFYTDWLTTFEKLEDAEAGKLVKHLLRYVNDLQPSAPDRLTDIVFEPMKMQLKRDLMKWEDTSTKRAELGRSGGIKSGETRRKKKEANEAKASFSKQNEHVIENVNDNVIVFSKENEIRPLADIEKLFFEDFEIHRMAFQENSFTVAELEQAKTEFWNAKKLDAETCAKPYSDTKKHFLNWSRKNKERIKKANTNGKEKRIGKVSESTLRDFINRSDNTSAQ